jgi:3-methyl-2-oxobutanoate hydroxymethyltransferase
MNKLKINNILNKKNKDQLVCLTAYSKFMSQILDKYCDIILVGDSLANVLYGMQNTHKISLDTMIKHARSVKRGVKKSLCVVDMPKNSYNNIKDAKKNAEAILKKTKCDAVKIEDNGKNHKIIKHLVTSGIAVMGHIGYTPQFKKKFKIQGITKKQEKKLINRAIKIEEAGAFSIVLECIKTLAAKKITKKTKIPTIGIGSSKYCDGQILVTEDILGLSGFKPRFVKQYTNLKKIIEKSIQNYRKEVIEKKFPKNINSY